MARPAVSSIAGRGGATGRRLVATLHSITAPMPADAPSPQLIWAFAASLALHAAAGAWLSRHALLAPKPTPPVQLEVRLKPVPLPESVSPRAPPAKPAPKPVMSGAPRAKPAAPDVERRRPRREAPPRPMPQLTRPDSEQAEQAPKASFSVPVPSEPQAAAPVAPPAPVLPAEPTSTGASSAPQFKAAYLNNPPPDYPTTARRRGQQGTTYLEVRVGANGQPLSIKISRSSGVPELDAAARDAVRGWTFVPGKRGGKAVESIVEVPIRFRLGD